MRQLLRSILLLVSFFESQLSVFAKRMPVQRLLVLGDENATNEMASSKKSHWSPAPGLLRGNKLPVHLPQDIGHDVAHSNTNGTPASRVARGLVQNTTVMPICYTSTLWRNSPGYRFTAPLTFAIVALKVSNEASENTQGVQVLLDNQTVFYARNRSPASTFFTNICVRAGTDLMILGRTGSWSGDYTAYCNKRASSIGGLSLNLQGMYTTQNINSSPATTFATSVNSGRVFMHYKLDCEPFGSIMPMCNHHSHDHFTRGLEFQANSTFSIAGLRLPNVDSDAVQSVQVFLDGESVFYAAGKTAGTVIPTKICVPAGSNVTLLGKAGTQPESVATSQCNAFSYNTTIGGSEVTVKGARTAINIHNGPATFPDSGDFRIGPIHVLYVMDCPSDSPSLRPSSSVSPSESPSFGFCTGVDSCGDCNQERPGEKGCSCQLCQQSVCTNDDYCCNTEWDRNCAEDAEHTCGCYKSSAPSSTPSAYPTTTLPPTNQPSETSGPTSTSSPTSMPTSNPTDSSCRIVGSCGNCNRPHPEPGCSCRDCVEAVCAKDGHCCTRGWDRRCVAAAEDLCHCPRPGSPTKEPSTSPSIQPTVQLFVEQSPSVMPSEAATDNPSSRPTLRPSSEPSNPTNRPSTSAPTTDPSKCLDVAGSCGDCNEHRDGLGCSCLVCQDLVCEIDMFCCLGAWEPSCAELAADTCRCPLPGSPTANPSALPSFDPTVKPTGHPSAQPTVAPAVALPCQGMCESGCGDCLEPHRGSSCDCAECGALVCSTLGPDKCCEGHDWWLECAQAAETLCV